MPSGVTIPEITKALEKMMGLNRLRRELLDETLRSKVKDAASLSLSDWHKHYGRMLRLMGFVLFEVSRCFIDKEEKSDFYFWPGYSSILEAEKPWRFQITSEHAPEIHGGLGVQSQDIVSGFDYIENIIQDKCSVNADAFYDLSNTSLWFDCVLTPHPGDVFNDGSPLVIGGTHPWVTQPDEISLEDGTSLYLLSIGISDHNESSAGKGVAEITLKKDEYGKWGKGVAAFLNKSGKVRAKRKWPLLADLSEVDTSLEEGHIRSISYRLYNIWLEATFDPYWKNIDVGWILNDAEKLENIKGLTNLAKRIRALIWATGNISTREAGLDGSERPYPYEWVKNLSPAHEYKYWYTLVLNPTIEIPGLTPLSRELGSAMIFSSHKIEDTFFTLIKPWVESIYLEFRSVESAVLLKRKNFGQMIGAFSHEVGKLGGQLLDSFLPSVPDVFGPKFGTPNKGTAWSRPAFDLDVPEEYVQYFSRWKLCPVPEVYEGLRLLFFIWGGSRNLLRALDISRENSEQGVKLKQLIAKLGEKARRIAAARTIVQQPTPRSLEDAIALQDQYEELCRNDVALFDDPEGNGSDLKLLVGGKESPENSTYFVRALMALLSNAAYHADPVEGIKVQLDLSDDRLTVILKNKPAKWSFHENELAGREGEGSTSPFRIASAGVVSRCVEVLSGGMNPFPAPGTDPFITSFWVSISRSDEEKEWILLQ